MIISAQPRHDLRHGLRLAAWRRFDGWDLTPFLAPVVHESHAHGRRDGLPEGDGLPVDDGGKHVRKAGGIGWQALFDDVLVRLVGQAHGENGRAL